MRISELIQASLTFNINVNLNVWIFLVFAYNFKIVELKRAIFDTLIPFENVIYSLDLLPNIFNVTKVFSKS